MTNVSIPISDLKPHPLNFNIYQDKPTPKDLLASIKKHGIMEPIVITGDKIIISGHRRFKAASELGFLMVECRVLDVSGELLEEKLIEFNRQRIKTATERVKEIRHLQNLFGVGQGKRTDLDDTSVKFDGGSKSKKPDCRSRISKAIGISTGNVSKLLFVEASAPELLQWIDDGSASIHQTYEEAKRREAKKGNELLKKINYSITEDPDSWRIVQGDSRDIDLGDVKAQTIICSPPYWALRDYGNDGQMGSEGTEREFLEELVGVFNHYRQYLKDDGCLFVEIGDSAFKNQYSGTLEKFVLLMIESGWYLRERIVLHKDNYGSNRPNTWTPAYSMLYFFSKGEKYKFNRDEIRRPYDGQRPPRAHIYKKTIDGDGIGRPRFPNPLGKPATNVITVRNRAWISALEKKTGQRFTHPATFPVALTKEPILATTDEGDLVIDCFSGSGTTGIQCLKLKRKYIGVELNEDFVNLSKLRLSVEFEDLLSTESASK